MELEMKNMPKHIAIIMDGNGRWAKRRGFPRVVGHREGVKAVNRVVKSASKFKIKYLTLYAFSMENWKRPQTEVKALMELLVISLDKNIRKLQTQGVRLKIIGNLSMLPQRVQQKLDNAVDALSNNKGLTLVLALNYGGKWDIVQSVQRIIMKEKQNTLDLENLSALITEDRISQNLVTEDIPNPDLLIRTSGEKRLSNFLLWQTAYSEFLFTDELWPDFGEDSLLSAIENYQIRERRFGGLKP